MTTIMPLLYQSGYITIKDYDEETELYTLAIPNKEIRVGLYRSLLPHYLTSKAASISKKTTPSCSIGNHNKFR